MSAAVVTSDSRYRHVVFPAAPRRALNLGLAPTCPRSVHRRRVATTTTTTTPSEDEAFIAWVFRQAGLAARDYRATPVRRRLTACLRALRAHDIDDARRALRRDPKLVAVAIDALLLGVTEYFRDAAVFDRLADELPRIASAHDASLRVWSAGASDGSELYSVAILLARAGLLHRGELLGTDCRPNAILRAQSCHEHDAFRGRVTWRCGDVLTATEPGPWDIILCRNLAMYLRPAIAEKLWRALAGALRPGGLLVVGRAERPATTHVPLTAAGPCMYRRDGAP